MIWVDTSASRRADNGASICDPNVTIAGQSFTFQDYGDSTCNQAPSPTTGGSAQLVLNTNETSGTMNILAVLDWLEANHPNLSPRQSPSVRSTSAGNCAAQSERRTSPSTATR